MKRETFVRITNNYIKPIDLTYGYYIESAYVLIGESVIKVGLENILWYKYDENVYAFEFNCPMKTTIKKSKKKIPQYKLSEMMRVIRDC